MLSEAAIRRALLASRVVPLEVPNPHGPLGLEQLAAAVAAHSEAIGLQKSKARGRGSPGCGMVS